MSYFTSSYDSRSGISHSLDGRQASPYYRQPTPTLASLSGLRFGGHHEPGRRLGPPFKGTLNRF